MGGEYIIYIILGVIILFQWVVMYANRKGFDLSNNMDYRIVEVRARKFEGDVVHYQVEQFEVGVSDEWEICADSDGDDSCHELLGDAKVELECLRSKPIYTVIPEEERQPKREKYPKDTTEIGDY